MINFFHLLLQIQNGSHFADIQRSLTKNRSEKMDHPPNETKTFSTPLGMIVNFRIAIYCIQLYVDNPLGVKNLWG